MPKIPPIKPLVVSVAQCATMLTLSRAMVYNLVKAGALPLIKIAGTRSGIEVAAIEEYVRRCAVGVSKSPNNKKPAPIAATPAEPRTTESAAAE